MKNILTLFIAYLAFSVNSQCNIASLPENITIEQTIDVVLEFGELIIEKKEYCLEGAQVVTESNCGLEEQSMVVAWFKIEPTNTLSGYLHTSVSTSFGIDPVWAYYLSTEDGFVQQGPCNNTDVSPEVSRYRFTGGDDIYVKVSIPSMETLDVVDFLTIKAFLNPYDTEEPCYGGDEHGFPEGTFDIEIVQRNIGALSDPILFAGEEIVVDISAFISTGANGSLWIQSVIPVLGDGWDRNYFTNNIDQSIVEGLSWIGNQDPCAGVFTADAAGLCVYTDQSGNLLICNSFTHDCPCEESVKDGDPLPDGFFGITNGGGATCSNDCTPSGAYGAGTAASNISLELLLRVSENILLDDLTLGFQVLADDLSGCWVEPQNQCRYITPHLNKEFVKASATGPYVYPLASDRSCSNNAFDINIVKNDIRSDSVTLSFIANSNLNFVSGSIMSTTDDSFTVEIENLSETPQIASFTLSGKDQDGENVSSFVNNIQVLPKLKVTNPVYTLCPADCINITVETNFDGLSQIEVIWDDGTVGSGRFICEGGEPITGQVTDLLGCDTVDFEIVTIPASLDPFELIIPEILCGNESYFVDIDGEGIDDSQAIGWNINIGNGGVTFEGSKTIFLDDEILNSIDGTIEIIANVIDVDGCTIQVIEEREVIQITDIKDERTICLADPPATISVDFPVDLNSDYEIIGLEEISGLGEVNYTIEDESSIRLVIDNPSIGRHDYLLAVNYELGCQQIIELGVIFSDGFLGELTVDVSDFEVDFGLSDVEGVESVIWNFGDDSTSEDLFPTHIYDQTGTYTVTVEMMTDCGSTTREIVVSIGTTATNTVKKDDILLYPNPTTGKLFIDYRTKGVEVKDNLGRPVSLDVHHSSGNTIIDFAGALNGIYFVKFAKDDEVYVKKIYLQD